jgi:hypothetical protein
MSVSLSARRKRGTVDVNDSGDNDRYVLWNIPTFERKERELLAILKLGPDQTVRMSIIYAAMTHMHTYMHPRFLQGGMAFFRGAVRMLWREFESDPESSGDYKRGKFIDALKRETEKMTSAHEKADNRWKRAANLDIHNKELFDMAVICQRYELPLRPLRYGFKRQGPIDDNPQNERITFIDIVRTEGNAPAFIISTKLRRTCQHVPSIVTLDPYLRVIPDALSIKGTSETSKEKPRTQVGLISEICDMVYLPRTLIRWIMWQESKSNMLQTFLFTTRVLSGKCVLPRNIVKTILAIHRDYILSHIKTQTANRQFDSSYYPRLPNIQCTWSLKQSTTQPRSIYDHSEFENPPEAKNDLNDHEDDDPEGDDEDDSE